MSTYRVREARVEVCNGYRCWFERRFAAERRISLFGLISFWWPVTNGGWRTTACAAHADAEADMELRAPLAKPQTLDL